MINRKLICLGILAVAMLMGYASSAADDLGWTVPSVPDKSAFTSTGKNPYFILESGYRLVLKKKEGPDTLIITVLRETKTVDGVETRIVEERETEGGELIEVSRNYFAIAKDSNDLFYFGEDVDLYKNGKITGHGGSWLAGVKGAHAGLMIPGKPAVGMKFYQEQAPSVAMDRSQIVSITDEVTTPAGKFSNCLKVADGSALEKDTETKTYAPGVGLLTDEDFELAKYGPAEEAK